MSIYPLYCENCKKTFNVRKEDLDLMKTYDMTFDKKVYTKGCFFKDLTKIKKEIKSKLTS